MADLSVNHLLREHQEARKFLTKLDSLVEALEADPRWTRERREAFQQISSFFLGDLCLLVRKENEVLYPALHELFPADLDPLALLRDEHETLCHNFHHLCEAGNSLKGGEHSGNAIEDLKRFGRKAVEVFHDHLYKEERVLFPMAARFLTPERDAELLERMQSLRAAEERSESLQREN